MNSICSGKWEVIKVNRKKDVNIFERLSVFSLLQIQPQDGDFQGENIFIYFF